VSIVVADIDAQEGVTATAYDINNNILDTLTLLSGDPLTGNRIGTLIELNAIDVVRLLLIPIPSSDGGIGWGLDNLSYETSTPVPEPTTILLFSSGLIGLAGFRRKYRKR
jgi:hypothetical protein